VSTRIWDGRITAGKICLEDREGFRALVESLEGKPVQMTLSRFRMTRSTPQNRYLWGVVYKILGEHLGYEAEELHEACKVRFLTDHSCEEVAGLKRIKSTAALDAAAFSDYVERVRQLAAELGVYIPDPGGI
jgi:hypothetical protein